VNESINKNFKLLFTIFILGLCWAITYALPFIQYLLYDPFKEAMGASNAQLGLLMTIYGVGNILGAPFGGWLSDRFNYKNIFIASLIGNGLLSIYFAFNMTYSSAIFVWIGLAVTGLFMNYPSHIKIVRLLVDEESQGKIFGMNEASVGVGSLIINAFVLFMFAKFFGGTSGLKVAVIVMGILSFACAIAGWFIVPNPDKVRINEAKNAKEAEGSKEKMTIKDFVTVITSPLTWMVGIGIFAIYSFSVTLSYFTPYFTALLGASVAFSGSLSLIRTHGVRFLGAPFGGWLGDKIGSVSKVLVVVYASGIAVLLLFMNLPSTTPAAILIGITLIIAFLVFMGRGVYYAVASEINIPRKYAASTVGVAAALGFLPDLFQFTLFGGWLDKYGVLGYRYMFIFQLVVLVIGLCGSLYVLKYKKGIEKAKQTIEQID